MPGWLGRLVPHISIEGEEYFAKRDSALALAADGTQSEDMDRFESRRPPEAGG
jgi:hypothetical protein